MLVFRSRRSCPFCASIGAVAFPIRYSETAEANPDISDVEAEVLSCTECGICFPSVDFDATLFADLYSKSLGDLAYFDQSLLQRIRLAVISRLIQWQRGGPLYSALQVPLRHRPIKALRVLDVGCGFGEFSAVYQRLGAKVTATEVIPQLVDRTRQRGIDCRLGSLETLNLPAASFDLILFRAVLYRCHDPAATIREAKRLLAPDGAISGVDPCTDMDGVRYFALKQFPQGRYYIVDLSAFQRMLSERFQLHMVSTHAIYGRPNAALKRVRLLGNLIGRGELLWNNIARRKPYALAYLLTP
jgi:SAM-dependent methyltransferase